MKTQKGLFTRVIILLVIGFGLYVYLNKNISQPNIIKNNNKNLTNLDIITNPIVTNSTTPTLTGFYGGDYGVGVVILNGKQILPKTTVDFSILPNIVLADYSDHGGNVDIDSPNYKSGKFTYTVQKPLMVGTYTVGVYVYHNIYYDEGYQGDSVQVLTASTTLVVKQ